MTNRDINFERKRFENALRFYGEKGIKPQSAKIRIDHEVTIGKGSYAFNVRKDQSTLRVTEKAITVNDLFLITAIGFGLVVEDVNLPGHSQVLTYPMLQSDALPAGLKGLVNNHAEVIYNGSLNMKTGQKVNLSAYPLNKFRFVPETQPVAMLDSGDAIVSSGLVPSYTHEDLMRAIPEELILSGTKNQPIEVVFPAVAGTDIKGEAGTKTYLVLLFDGFLLEGATNPDFNVKENPYYGII